MGVSRSAWRHLITTFATLSRAPQQKAHLEGESTGTQAFTFQHLVYPEILTLLLTQEETNKTNTQPARPGLLPHHAAQMGINFNRVSICIYV